MAFILLFLIVVVAAIGLTIRIVPEHERAVVFRLGRSKGVRGPGPIIAVRGLDDAKRVSTKVIVIDIPIGQVITRDEVEVEVEATIYLRVTDPAAAVIEVDNYRIATAHVAHSVIRAHLGGVRSDRLLHDQPAVNAELATAITERTKAWGVTVEQAEISDVELPERPSVGGLRVDEPAEFGDF